jgi:hypothetical protein
VPQRHQRNGLPKPNLQHRVEGDCPEDRIPDGLKVRRLLPKTVQESPLEFGRMIPETSRDEAMNESTMISW